MAFFIAVVLAFGIPYLLGPTNPSNTYNDMMLILIGVSLIGGTVIPMLHKGFDPVFLIVMVLFFVGGFNIAFILNKDGISSRIFQKDAALLSLESLNTWDIFPEPGPVESIKGPGRYEFQTCDGHIAVLDISIVAEKENGGKLLQPWGPINKLPNCIKEGSSIKLLAAYNLSFNFNEFGSGYKRSITDIDSSATEVNMLSEYRYKCKWTEEKRTRSDRRGRSLHVILVGPPPEYALEQLMPELLFVPSDNFEGILSDCSDPRLNGYVLTYSPQYGQSMKKPVVPISVISAQKS